MKKFCLLLIITAAISTAANAQAGFAPASTGNTGTSNVLGSALSGSSIDDLERRTFELINERRLAAGMSRLIWSEDMLPVARIHSQNMADLKFFSHRGKDGTMVDDRADIFGLGQWQAIGENIAYMRGYQDPCEFAVDRWMQSATHRDNLLNKDWSETAVGIAIAGDGSYYFTQVFLLR